MHTRRAVLLGALATGAAWPAGALPEPKSDHTRRIYMDGPFGQIHARVATPRPGPGSKAPPLILLHQSPLSGRMFDRILPLLAQGRTAIAVDTPGYGESDRPSTRPSLGSYSDAILEALGQSFGKHFDLLGYHTGTGLAADLAARHPSRIRKLVLISVPYFEDERRRKLISDLGAEAAYADDGSHLLPLWTGTFRVRPTGQSMDDVARIVAEKQRVGRHGAWALMSLLERNMMPLLRQIAQPTLVLAPHDGLQDETAAAAKIIKSASIIDLPKAGYGLFDSEPAQLAALVLRFLGS